MLAWVRERLRVIAVIVLAATVGVGGVSSVGHGSDCHGDECGLAAFPHDPSSHSVGAPSAAPSHPLHCVLCHWTRSIRPSAEPIHHLATPAADDFRFHAEVRDFLSLVQAAQPPLRSPPVVFSFA
jgi:hypothetical protein